MALRRTADSPPIRQIDLADVLLDVSEILDLPAIDVYLFGSRRFQTGSVRSDIDLIVPHPGRILRERAERIWALEPYLDIFYGSGGEVQSLVNESMISQPDLESLLSTLGAVPLLNGGTWQTDADVHRVQQALAERQPSATIVELYDLGQSLPAARADILVMTALAEEFRAAVEVLSAVRDGDVARTVIEDRGGSPWKIEIALINSMGSVQASLETLEALRRTKAPHVVLLGLAAGVPGVVELEDVVIPEQIVYYEGQKVTGDSFEQAPVWKATNPKVRRLAAVLPELAGTTVGRDRVRVHSDIVMACGEKVVASDAFRASLNSTHRKLGCIDMESYGVACAAERKNASFTVIKSVCDFADESKGDSHRAPASTNSANQFRVLVVEKAFAHDSDP